MICRHLNKILSCSIATIIAFSALEARDLNFSKCQEYYLKASKIFGDIRAIHIGGGKFVAYCAQNIESSALIKRNSSMNLCLFQDAALEFKFDLVKINTSAQTAAIDADSRIAGKIIAPQKSFDNLAIFSKDMPPNSVISDICYQAYGISAQGARFIDTNYINIFLKSDASVLSSVGINVKMEQNALIVENVNPLLGENVAQGDEILSINGKTIASADDFTNFIAQIPPHTNVKIKIKRNGEIIETEIATVPKNQSAQNSFLAPFGVNIDENLRVISASDPSFSKMRANDQILAINGIPVGSIDELNNAITSSHARMNRRHFGGSDWEFTTDSSQIDFELLILILRNNFEFFITISKDEL